MGKNKKLIIIVAVVAVLAIGSGAYLLYKATQNSSQAPTGDNTDTSGDIVIPATTEEQNEAAAKALELGLVAMNSGNKAEAKKQLAIAEKLYEAAGNQDGLDNVRGQILVADTIQERPTPEVEGSKSN